MKALFFVAIGLAAVLGSASPGGAAEKKGTIKMDVLTVQGELQKPQASYIVQRSNKISLSEDLKSKAPRVTSRIAETLSDDLFVPKP